MASKPLMSGASRIRRFWAAGFLALAFAAAQALVAGHSDATAAHAPQACEYCLAAAIADDPNDAVVRIDPPSYSLEQGATPDGAALSVGAVQSFNSRAPPVC